MMSRMMAMQSDDLQSQIVDEVINEAIQQCFQRLERINKYVHDACLILEKWEKEVRTKSEEPVYVYGHNMLKPVAPYRMFLVLQKAVDAQIQEIERAWKETLHGRLVSHVTRWKTSQLHRWVGRRPENTRDKDASDVENLCEKVNAMLKCLLQCVSTAEFRQVDSLLRDQGQELSSSRATPVSTSFSRILAVVVEALSLFSVIVEQPPPVLFMESGNKKESPGTAASGKKGDGGQSGKKGQNKTGTKKKHLRTTGTKKKHLRTTVGILGGSGFGGGVAVTDVTLGLGLNSDLAKSRPYAWAVEDLVKIYGTLVDEKGLAAYERTLEDLKLEHFKRNESKEVWQLLYHAVYFVTVTIQDLPADSSSFSFQVLSFPLKVAVAANQASEHTGAHLWHSFSSRNVYDLNSVVVPALQIADVIKMLKEGLRGISDRELRPYEEVFLHEKLERAIKEKAKNGAKTDFVTLETFIKQPVTLAHNPGTKMSFSLWQWIHSIFNLLKHTLQKPWADGVIYGFASHEQCRAALGPEAVGTCLLRFSESGFNGNHGLSQGYLNTAVKIQGFVLFIEAIDATNVKENGLASNMKHTVCEVVLGTNLTVQELIRRYPATDPDRNPSIYLKVTDPLIQKPPQIPLETERLTSTGKRRRTGADTLFPSTTRCGCCSGNCMASKSAGSSPQSVLMASSPPEQAVDELANPMSIESQSPSCGLNIAATPSPPRMSGFQDMEKIMNPSVSEEMSQRNTRMFASGSVSNNLPRLPVFDMVHETTVSSPIHSSSLTFNIATPMMSSASVLPAPCGSQPVMLAGDFTMTSSSLQQTFSLQTQPVSQLQFEPGSIQGARLMLPISSLGRVKKTIDAAVIKSTPDGVSLMDAAPATPTPCSSTSQNHGNPTVLFPHDTTGGCPAVDGQTASSGRDTDSPRDMIWNLDDSLPDDLLSCIGLNDVLPPIPDVSDSDLELGRQVYEEDPDLTQLQSGL